MLPMAIQLARRTNRNTAHVLRNPGWSSIALCGIHCPVRIQGQVEEITCKHCLKFLWDKSTSL